MSSLVLSRLGLQDQVCTGLAGVLSCRPLIVAVCSCNGAVAMGQLQWGSCNGAVAMVQGVAGYILTVNEKLCVSRPAQCFKKQISYSDIKHVLCALKLPHTASGQAKVL